MLHSLNALLEIVAVAFWKLILVSVLHPEKAFPCIVFKLIGKSTLSNDLQPAKA